MKNLEEKFSKIYDDYVSKIYRFIYIKVDSRDIAQDLTSEVFVRFLNSLKKDLNIENVQAFLYRIARNIIVDYYRDKAKKQTMSIDGLPIADNASNMFEAAMIGSDMENVKFAISKLNDDYQNVVIWHYLDDMPISEIAKMMDKSEGAVRVTLSRALEKLRGEMPKESVRVEEV